MDEKEFKEKVTSLADSILATMPDEKKKEIMSSLITKEFDTFANHLASIFNMFGMASHSNKVGLAIGNTLFDMKVTVAQFDSEAELADAAETLTKKYESEAHPDSVRGGWNDLDEERVDRGEK